MRTIRLLRPAICVLLLGCFTLQPTMGQVPVAGSQVALDLNDAGRLALGGSMGPGIAQIQGRLLEASDGEYQIAVSAVRLLRGEEQIWSGEKVRVRSEHLGAAYERRFSRGRSIALGAVSIGGLAAFMVAHNLIGAGSGKDPVIPVDTGFSLRVRP